MPIAASCPEGANLCLLEGLAFFCLIRGRCQILSKFFDSMRETAFVFEEAVMVEFPIFAKFSFFLFFDFVIKIVSFLLVAKPFFVKMKVDVWAVLRVGPGNEFVSEFCFFGEFLVWNGLSVVVSKRLF